MKDKRQQLVLSWKEIYRRASAVSQNLRGAVYGVPRGGIFAALLMTMSNDKLYLTEHPEDADLIIDDILDTGSTRHRYKEKFPEIPFGVLVDKPREGITSWVSFPWERMQEEDGPQDNIRRILQYIGEDPKREGLLETPDRVVKSYSELFVGYKQDPADVFKTFEDGACDEIVLLKNIEFSSSCEHHLLPFFGQAHVAYIPDGKVIGVSKLARLVDIFAKRLQIQERITIQVTTALDTHLRPKGSACVLTARHMCMTCRGVGKQHSEMVTSSLTGAFKQEVSARQELLTLIYGGK